MKTLLTALFILLTAISFAQTPELDSAFHKDYVEMDSLKIEGFKAIRHDCLIRLKFGRAHELKREIKSDTIVTKTRSWIHPFFSQFSEKPVIEKEDVIIYSLQFLAGLADGTNQALVYHHALAGHPFWDYNTSWKRKYKNYNKGDLRPAFPGAKTWAVGVTDGNHLTRMVNRGASLLSVSIAMSEHDKWYEIVKEAIISSLINRIGFTIMYDHVFKN